MSIFKETNNTQLAREHLLKYTDISIKVITLEQFINESKHNYKGLEGANGAIEKRGDHFAIGLNNNKPETHENTFVHEILHKILHYENLGLCKDGEAGRMIDDGEVALGGRIPVNVSGGLLSKGHPLGATGIANIYEVSTHLRGEADKRQVEGARFGMTHVIGLGSACGIHILEKVA